MNRTVHEPVRPDLGRLTLLTAATIHDSLSHTWALEECAVCRRVTQDVILIVTGGLVTDRQMRQVLAGHD